MPRLMSVAFTEDAVRDRSKTVTRRKGWQFLKPGDRVTLCRKVMGRKKDEPLIRITDVQVVSVRRERLITLRGHDYGDDEMRREGFPDMSVYEFVEKYFAVAQGMNWWDEVTRIEWRYLDA